MTIDEFMRDIAPKMKKGYVAMNPCNQWEWHSNKPYNNGNDWEIGEGFWCPLSAFDIARADDWKKTLRKSGNGNNKTPREIELEKKLDIAVKALEWAKNTYPMCELRMIDKALKETKG